MPDPPSDPQIGTSAVGNRYVTINWQPSSNGYSPIRNYTIEIEKDGQDWEQLEELVPPDAVAYTITEYDSFLLFGLLLNQSLFRHNSFTENMILTRPDNM